MPPNLALVSLLWSLIFVALIRSVFVRWLLPAGIHIRGRRGVGNVLVDRYIASFGNSNVRVNFRGYANPIILIYSPVLSTL
jgi:hypothetical protein